jgi:hypothetical protein
MGGCQHQKIANPCFVLVLMLMLVLVLVLVLVLGGA